MKSKNALLGIRTGSYVVLHERIFPPPIRVFHHVLPVVVVVVVVATAAVVGMDSTLLFAAVTGAASYLYYRKRHREDTRGGRQFGTKHRTRVQRSVESIRDEMGDYLFKRVYMMSYTSFKELHCLLEPLLISVHKEVMDAFSARRRQRQRRTLRTRRMSSQRWKRYVPNGAIHTTVRLAIALRFFAGGSIYDIAPLYGVGRTDAFASVWMVVEAIHRSNVLRLIFPDNHDEQRQLAQEFARRSQAGFDCCVGAVDGILIWILQPSPSCCRASHCDATKFFCGRKHKFGLNCQAVADCRGKFLDMSIRYPASTSDCLAFESSDLYGNLMNGLLAEGLCLFGDNAYLNSPFLATPYPNVSSGYKDAYNFFHSQMRIRVECAFGMFVQRWGILRCAIPKGISLRKTIAMVLALAKIHNFCIDQTDTNILALTDADELRLLSNELGSVPLDDIEDSDETTDHRIPTQLIGAGEHFEDVPRGIREIRRRSYSEIRLPRERLAEDYVQGNNYQRPRPRGTAA